MVVPSNYWRLQRFVFVCIENRDRHVECKVEASVASSAVFEEDMDRRDEIGGIYCVYRK